MKSFVQGWRYSTVVEYLPSTRKDLIRTCFSKNVRLITGLGLLCSPVGEGLMEVGLCSQLAAVEISYFACMLY
jgi:hypothetical protein